MNFSCISLVKWFHLWIKELFLNSFTGVTWLNLELSTDHAWSRVGWHVNLDIFNLKNDSHSLVGLKHRWSELSWNQIANVGHFVINIFLICFFFCLNSRVTSLFLSSLIGWCVFSFFIFNVFLDHWTDFFLRAFSNLLSSLVCYLCFLCCKSLLMLLIFLVVLSNMECCSNNYIWKIWI